MTRSNLPARAAGLAAIGALRAVAGLPARARAWLADQLRRRRPGPDESITDRGA